MIQCKCYVAIIYKLAIYSWYSWYYYTWEIFGGGNIGEFVAIRQFFTHQMS